MSWWRRRPRIGAEGPLSCGEVALLLQQYLDDETDGHTADRVSAHLDDCRRCGLEAEVYRDIKAAVGERRGSLPVDSIDRLRRFGERLAAGEIPEGD